MPTVHDKVTRIIAVKAAIKDAIEAKGPVVGSIPFDEYALKIAEIADLSAAQAAVEAVNGETSVDLDTAIALTASTKLAIETAIETAGVDVPALTVFADYPAYVADAVAKAAHEASFNFDAANKRLVSVCYNTYSAPLDVVIPSTIGGVAVETILDYGFSSQLIPQKLITSIYIPDSVKTLGAKMVDSSALASIRLSQNPALTVIPTECFNCNGGTVSEIELSPYVTTVALYAFAFLPIIKITLGANVAIANNPTYPAFGAYGAGFETLYNGNGQLAGTYEYAAGTWSKTA